MLTLGSDPEFFIQTYDGQLKSIVGIIGGTKKNPKYIDDTGSFAIQEDNVAAEYNIPPSYTKEQFIQHILWPQEYISALIGTNKFTINQQASAYFPQEELKTKEAQTFGCDPDLSAYTLTYNEKPENTAPTFRTCGGHIHFGVENKSPKNILRIIKAMDRTLGVWSVIVDKDRERRKLYGKAGCFRPQKHGGEYRTLSNFWIFNPELISEVWDRAQAAETLTINELEDTLIQHIINTSDYEAASTYLKNSRLT